MVLSKLWRLRGVKDLCHNTVNCIYSQGFLLMMRFNDERWLGPKVGNYIEYMDLRTANIKTPVPRRIKVAG